MPEVDGTARTPPAEKAVMASRDKVGYSNLILSVPHAVSLILSEKHDICLLPDG